MVDMNDNAYIYTYMYICILKLYTYIYMYIYPSPSQGHAPPGLAAAVALTVRAAPPGPVDGPTHFGLAKFRPSVCNTDGTQYHVHVRSIWRGFSGTMGWTRSPDPWCTQGGAQCLDWGALVCTSFQRHTDAPTHSQRHAHTHTNTVCPDLLCLDAFFSLGAQGAQRTRSGPPMREYLSISVSLSLVL